MRKAYAATLTMNDRKLGQLFDLMDGFNMWEDTAVILTTDHGYLLGEHHAGLLFGYFGREVNMTDGKYTYHRMPADGSVCDYHFTDYNIAGPEAVNVMEWKGRSHADK